MSNLIASLLNNADALNVHAKGAEVAGKNMSRVNDPNYARQRVNVSNLSTVQTAYGPQAMGVTVESLSHARSSLLDGQVVREAMGTGSLDTQLSYGRSVEASLGEQLDRTQDGATVGSGSGAGSGISGALDELFNSFHNVAAAPRDDSQKQMLLEAAESLSMRFNEVDRRLGVVDADAATQIASEVKEVNTLLGEIADLNLAISKGELKVPGSALDLRDRRQAALEELGRLVNYEMEQTGPQGGDLRIFVRDGASNPVDLVNGRDHTGTLAYDGTSTFSVGGTNVVVNGGSIAGAQAVRSGVIADTRANLNDLAAQLIAEVNTAYGANFFAGANASDIALDPAVTVATLQTTATADAGANELMLALAEVGDDATVSFNLSPGPGVWSGTFSQRMANIVSQTGTAVADAEVRLESQRLVEGMIKEQRDSLGAVSMDEEVADLLRYQRAFQGTARVINVMDQMLEWVVTRL